MISEGETREESWERRSSLEEDELRVLVVVVVDILRNFFASDSAVPFQVKESLCVGGESVWR